MLQKSNSQSLTSFSFFHSSCSVNWESQSYNATSYIIFIFVFGLVVPVNVIIYSYIRIIKTMRDNALRSGRVNKVESRVTSMIFVMIIGEIPSMKRLKLSFLVLNWQQLVEFSSLSIPNSMDALQYFCIKWTIWRSRSDNTKPCCPASLDCKIKYLLQPLDLRRNELTG